jgi:hypothetical protein
MDRIIKITLGLFIAILIAAIASAGYAGYTSGAYASTRVSEYTYSCSITTDSPLANVTLFIPVPADPSGNSPVVSQYSAREIPGIPASWQTTLFDTGKATLVKVFIPALVPPAGTTADKPYTLTLATTVPSEKVIDTADPVEGSAMFRPVQEPVPVACRADPVGNGGNPECTTYQTSVYADYIADPGTTVSITSSITGTNTWAVFGQKSNAYTSGISLILHGGNHGWVTARGTLMQKAGSYDPPFSIR